MNFTPKEDKYRSKYLGILNRFPDDTLQTENDLKDFIAELSRFIDEADEQTESIYFAKKDITKFTGRIKNYAYFRAGDNEESMVKIDTIADSIPYQLAVEKSGYLQGYISAAQKTNAHAFDPKFIEAVYTLCQFVKEHPPQMITQINTPQLNIEEAMKYTQKYSGGSETK